MAVNGKAPDVARLLKEFPARREMTEQGELVRGLAVRLTVNRSVTGGEMGGAVAELQLGESARVYPSDAALAGWRAQADQGQSAIVYE